MPRPQARKRKPTTPVQLSSRPTSLRHINARELYLLLREHGPCSRADLVRLSGMSGPTVSRGIDYLEKRDLVISLGFGESGGARPPDQLSLNHAAVYVAGLEIRDTRLRVALADLQGNRFGPWVSDLPRHKSPERVVQALATGVDLLLKQNGIRRSKLHAVSVSTPGIPDAKTGKLIFAPFLNWGDISLSKLLQRAFRIPVTVENEANLYALGERAYGVAKGEDHFVFLDVDSGVGAGIFINGMLYRGARGSAGEIGYMQVPAAPRGPFSTTLPGTLEKVAGGRGIEESWRARAKGKRGKSTMTAAAILALAEERDAVAMQVVETAAKALCDVIANITALLDPTLIILGGPVGSSPVMFDAVQRALKVQKHDPGRITVRLSHCGADAALWGALKTAIETAEAGLLDFTLNGTGKRLT